MTQQRQRREWIVHLMAGADEGRKGTHSLNVHMWPYHLVRVCCSGCNHLWKSACRHLHSSMFLSVPLSWSCKLKLRLARKVVQGHHSNIPRPKGRSSSIGVKRRLIACQVYSSIKSNATLCVTNNGILQVITALPTLSTASPPQPCNAIPTQGNGVPLVCGAILNSALA